METIQVQYTTAIPKNFTGIAEYPNGDKHWFKDGKLHREDGPAIEWVEGPKFWWIEGIRHRIAGPAVEYSDGIKEWWIEGKNYSENKLKTLTELSIFLGKEKGKHNLEWLSFLTEKGIEEFAIVPEMEFIKHERISNDRKTNP